MVLLFCVGFSVAFKMSPGLQDTPNIHIAPPELQDFEKNVFTHFSKILPHSILTLGDNII